MCISHNYGELSDNYTATYLHELEQYRRRPRSKRQPQIIKFCSIGGLLFTGFRRSALAVYELQHLPHTNSTTTTLQPQTMEAADISSVCYNNDSIVTSRTHMIVDKFMLFNLRKITRWRPFNTFLINCRALYECNV